MAGSDSGEKTEKATPKKRRDTREEGQVLKSQELITAVMLTASFAAIKFFGGSFVNGMREYLITSTNIETIGVNEFNASIATKIVNETILTFLLSIAPFLAIAFITAAVINYAQVGFLFTTKPLKPKFSKMNPIEGFKRIFSMRSIFELIKTIIKVAVIGVVVYNGYMKELPKMPAIMEMSIWDAGTYLADAALSIAFQAAIALIAIGVVDFLYQWFEHEKKLRMTKQEIKEETKMVEGDPQIKAQIRARQREMGMRRMMQAVPSADVVITNPTHYAVALRYDETKAAAPICVAKGKDRVALRIKEIAIQNNVDIIEDKPLAQGLYASTEIDKEIPSKHFQAVAEILAYIYKARNKI